MDRQGSTEKGDNSMEWIDREALRNKIKQTLNTEKCEKIDAQYINVHLFSLFIFKNLKLSLSLI